MWTPPQRNTDKIQYETYRKKIDQKFNDFHDELTIAYYDFWKKGESKPVNAGSKIYDVQSTIEQSKALFNKLHGLCFHLQESLAF